MKQKIENNKSFDGRTQLVQSYATLPDLISLNYFVTNGLEHHSIAAKTTSFLC